MICLAFFLLLSMSTCVVASKEIPIEKKSSVTQVMTKELAQVTLEDKTKPAEKKIEKEPEAPKQLPVTTSFFAKKTLSTMDFDELKKSKDDCLKADDKRTAIKYLERMSQLRSDLEDLKGIMIELASLLFELEDYKKASEMYNKFVLLYPGCDEIELSMYRAIFSMSKLMLDAEHDQTKTVETKELAQEFLKRSTFTTYKKDVQAMLTQCEERLLESEINIFNFYMKRGNYVAANSRLINIKDEYANTTIPDIATKLASLDQKYAQETVDIKVQSLVVAAKDDDAKSETAELKAA